MEQRENEGVELKATHGTIAQDIREAFEEMATVAAASQCKNFLYHASINPKEGEHLTPEQWEKAVELLAQKLGLEGHQRVEVEHIKDGRAHRHVVFNRVDPDTLTAVRMSHNYRKHEAAAREMEREFGLDHVNNSFDRGGGDGGGKPYEQKDFDQARRTKKDPRRVTADLSAAWEESSTGAEFIIKADKLGYIIAKGDRRDFVAIDEGGGVHSVGRRTKTKAADVRQKMADIDPDILPDVEKAREYQQAREQERERRQKAKAGAGMYNNASMDEQQQDANRHAKDRNEAKQEQARREQAQRADEQKQQEQAKREQAQKEAPQKQERQAREQREQQRKQGERPQPQQQAGADPRSGTKSGAIGKERGQGEQRADEQKARTEQTAEQVRAQQQKAMRELFERNFGSGHNEATKERWERGRTRER